MRRLLLVVLSMCMAMSLVACNKTQGEGADGTPAGGGSSAEGKGPGASMIGDAVFEDAFDGSKSVPGQISAAVVAESNYEGQWGPSTASNPTATESGGMLQMDAVTDYKAYDPSMLNAAQGTFEMLFTPADDILTAFTAQNQTAWQKFMSYDPPGNGFLIDTIGWRAAPQGSFGLLAGFTEATATVSWGIWDGAAWHYVTYSESPWEPRPYRITASYGPAGVRLYVDGELADEDPSYGGGVDTGQPVVLGQAPWYWPYGAHSMLGTIQEFKYSAAQK